MVESPCISECGLEDGVCVACGRTREEIVNWSQYTDEKRAEVIDRLK